MAADTSPTSYPTTAEQNPGLGGANTLNGVARVHQVAQTLHQAVDTLEQKIGQGSEKMMGMQEEYGNLARERVRENPLAALGIAFVAGFVLAKILR